MKKAKKKAHTPAKCMRKNFGPRSRPRLVPMKKRFPWKKGGADFSQLFLFHQTKESLFHQN